MRALSMKLSNWERVFRFRQINFWFIGNPVVVPLPNMAGGDSDKAIFACRSVGQLRAQDPCRRRLAFSQLDLSCSRIFIAPFPSLGEAARSRYHVVMAQRPRFVPAILLLLILLLSGCQRHQKSTSVTVHLLRDLRSVYGSELDRRILDFEGSNPRVQSGQHIVIASETGDYKDMLSRQSGSSDNIDLIILNSPDDAGGSTSLQAALPQAVNVCAGLKACPANVPAIIPSQIGGSDREAAQKFVDFLQKAPSS